MISGALLGLMVESGATIQTVSNSSSGIIKSVLGPYPVGPGISVQINGLIGSIINAGYISTAYTSGFALDNFGRINLITNLSGGSIIGGIANAGGYDTNTSIGSIYNHSSISGFVVGIYTHLNASISSITNFGSITGPYASIFNQNGYIGTLNNAQGAGNVDGALTYTGNLPQNYYIIVSSQNNYGTLAAYSAIGTTNFGVYSSSVLTKGTYASVLSGLEAGVNVNATSGMHNGTGWRLIETVVGTGIWDLIADYSASNTLVGLKSNANALSTVYNQQAAAYQAALSYDCQVYDAAGLCVSVGGRYTYAGPSPSSNQQAGLVIVGYKPVQTVRVGAFADQSVNISTPSGFSQSKSSPMWGLFAKWHMNKDETGLGVQASAVTSSSSLTATRPQLFNTESGSGTTQFDGQGYQLTTNYHKPVTNNTALVPYLGLRYTRINAGAYTENTTATVTSPLSYNAMAQSTFSAIGGIGVRSHLAEKLTGTASVGIQQNLNYSMGNYAGTSSIMGLETFSVQMPSNVNSMATATAGLFYDINKRERLGLNVLWQQQPFIAANTTTALATYTIGF
jgi:hypothetical protein